MKKWRRNANATVRMLAALAALAMIVAACGPSEAESDARQEALRKEPILTTPPPDAIVIGEFGRGPISAAFGAIRSGARVMTLWASTASADELEAWYTTEFEDTYDFATLRDLKGGFDLADIQSSSSIRVGIKFPELTMLSEFGGQTFNQDTHPGMTFVLAEAAEQDNFGDGG